MCNDLSLKSFISLSLSFLLLNFEEFNKRSIFGFSYSKINTLTLAHMCQFRQKANWQMSETQCLICFSMTQYVNHDQIYLVVEFIYLFFLSDDETIKK